VSSLRISYKPRFDATPEAEIAALSACYRFLLDCHRQKGVIGADNPDDAEDLDNDCTDTNITPE